MMQETLNLGGMFDRLKGASLKPAMQRCLLAMKSSIQENFDRGASPDGRPWPNLRFPRPGSQGSDKPLRDRGLLLASAITSSANAHIEEVTDKTAEVGSIMEYARIQHEGGTIRAKNGLLAIPKTLEAKRAGRPRNFRGKLHFRGKSKDKGALFDGQGVMQYALTRQVTLQARPFIGWNEETLKECEEIVTDYVLEQIGR